MSVHLGLHVGTSGGYDGAIAYTRELGCDAMQIFVGNPKAYRTGPLDVPALERFREARERAGIARCVIHTSYLINFATDDAKIAESSRALVEKDLAAAAIGGIDFVNTHLGSYGKRSRDEGFGAVAVALERALQTIAPGVTLVLENSAGAGSLCGGTLDELGAFVKAIDHPQLGVCLDTAHSWAAGYEIDSEAGVERFIADADAAIGLDRVAMFHLNDTQIPLGGHKDRHWHIGEGLIGAAGFRALLHHPRLAGKTAILETPGESADDARNVAAIRALEGTGRS